MSKKHFIALADVMRAFLETNAGREMDVESQGVLLQHIANFCSDQNGRFDRNRWFDYIAGKCGHSGGAGKK